VLEISPRTASVGAIINYSPREPRPFIYDPSQGIFAVGREERSQNLSPHERLVAVTRANSQEVVGGKFYRGPNGEIITNEASGHFGHQWNDQNRQQFIEFLEGATGVPVQHKAKW
jgi:Bacterial toxin 43